MVKRSRRDDEDFATNALRVVEESIGAPLADPAQRPKNPNAKALGRLGGLKGGVARAKGMTAEQRSASAQKAARTRWAKHQANPAPADVHQE